MRRIHRGIIHQEEDSLLLEVVYHRRGWANAPRHRCIIEPGNPTGGQPFRSNEKEPRASIQEGARFFSLSLSPSNRGIWRTRRGGEQAKGVCKSQWKCRRIFHLSPPFPRNSVRARFTFFQRPLFLRGEISNRSCSRRIKN